MDEQQLLRKVQRQLRTIKILLGIFFVMLLAMLAVLGFIAYKVVTFTQQVNTKIDKFQTTTSQSLNENLDSLNKNLDFKNKVCSNKSLMTFLGTNNDLCK